MKVASFHFRIRRSYEYNFKYPVFQCFTFLIKGGKPYFPSLQFSNSLTVRNIIHYGIIRFEWNIGIF